MTRDEVLRLIQQGYFFGDYESAHYYEWVLKNDFGEEYKAEVGAVNDVV